MAVPRAVALKGVLAGLIFCATLLARAEPMEGADYLAIDPPQSPPTGQVEVIEFFHYGCTACYRLEPRLARWAAGLPRDVRFVRVPALRKRDWIPLTRLFFALDDLGELPRLHSQVFEDIHAGGLNLGDSTQAASWAERNGVDRVKFLEALNAGGMEARVQRARDLTVAYGVRATPSIAVDGRYLTSVAMVGSIDALFPVVDALIEKSRALRPGQ